MQSVGLLAEVVQDVLGDLANAIRVQQSLFVLCCTQFLLVLLGLNSLELRANIVVVHLELQDLLVADGIGNHIRMQLTAKHTGRGLGAQGVLREDGRAGEAKLTELLELLLQVFLGLTKLAAVALIKDEDHLLTVDRQVRFALHEVVELLDGGHDDLVVLLFQVAPQPSRAIRSIYAVRREALVFLHGLVVQILAVHHEEHFVDEIQLGGQARCLKAGQGLAAAGGVPDEATAFYVAPVLGLMAALDLPQNAFCGGDLVRAHHEQRIADIKHRVVQQHIEQRVLLEKGSREVLQVLDQAVVRLRPVHGEVEAVFIALGGVGKVTAVRAVGNHKQLQILEQGMQAVKALLAVAVHLVKGFTNCHSALLQFHLHQRQAVDQNGHVIAIGM